MSRYQNSSLWSRHFRNNWSDIFETTLCLRTKWHFMASLWQGKKFWVKLVEQQLWISVATSCVITHIVYNFLLHVWSMCNLLFSYWPGASLIFSFHLARKIIHSHITLSSISLRLHCIIEQDDYSSKLNMLTIRFVRTFTKEKEEDSNKVYFTLLYFFFWSVVVEFIILLMYIIIYNSWFLINFIEFQIIMEF